MREFGLTVLLLQTHRLIKILVQMGRIGIFFPPMGVQRKRIVLLQHLALANFLRVIIVCSILHSSLNTVGVSAMRAENRMWSECGFRCVVYSEKTQTCFFLAWRCGRRPVNEGLNQNQSVFMHPLLLTDEKCQLSCSLFWSFCTIHLVH